MSDLKRDKHKILIEKTRDRLLSLGFNHGQITTILLNISYIADEVDTMTPKQVEQWYNNSEGPF